MRSKTSREPGILDSCLEALSAELARTDRTGAGGLHATSPPGGPEGAHEAEHLREVLLLLLLLLLLIIIIIVVVVVVMIILIIRRITPRAVNGSSESGVWRRRRDPFGATARAGRDTLCRMASICRTANFSKIPC